MDETTTTAATSTPVNRYWYPVWWVVSWRHHCSVGRKIAALVLFPLFFVAIVDSVGCLVLTVLMVLRVVSPSEIGLEPAGAVGIGTFALVLLAWPFLLVIAPPTPTRDGKSCCSGCGRVDPTLRSLEYTVGFALFGLIPIYGTYKRPLCSLCHGLVYRVVIIFQNLFALICIPVGTVMGIIWLVKNNKRSAINVQESLQLHEPGT